MKDFPKNNGKCAKPKQKTEANTYDKETQNKGNNVE